MENIEKILEICPLKSMEINIDRTIEQLNLKYCTEIAELRYKNLLLKEELDMLAASIKNFEERINYLNKDRELREKKIDSLTKSSKNFEEKFKICLINNSDLSSSLSAQNNLVEDLKSQIENLTKENQKISNHCASQEKLLQISSSEETIKLKTDVEELKKIICKLNEKLETIGDGKVNQVTGCKGNLLEITFKELENSYQELLKENKELKKKLTIFS